MGHNLIYSFCFLESLEQRHLRRLMNELYQIEEATIDETRIYILDNFQITNYEVFIHIFQLIVEISQRYSKVLHTLVDLFLSIYRTISIEPFKARIINYINQFFIDIEINTTIIKIIRLLNKESVLSDDSYIALIEKYYLLSSSSTSLRKSYYQRIYILLKISFGKEIDFDDDEAIKNDMYYEDYIKFKNSLFCTSDYVDYLYSKYPKGSIESMIIDDDIKNFKKTNNDFNFIDFTQNTINPTILFDEHRPSYIDLILYYDSIEIFKFLKIKKDYILENLEILLEVLINGRCLKILNCLLQNYGISWNSINDSIFKFSLIWNENFLFKFLFADDWARFSNTENLKLAILNNNLKMVKRIKEHMEKESFHDHIIIRKELKNCKLKNIQSNCYLNCIFRVLFSLPNFTKALYNIRLSQNEGLITFLRSTFYDLDHYAEASISKNDFYRSLGRSCPNDQQDVIEIITIILNFMPPIVRNMFKTLCLSKNNSVSFEKFLIIDVEPVYRNIQESVNQFFNKKRIVISPMYLIIQLKRFNLEKKTLNEIRMNTFIKIGKFSFFKDKIDYYLESIIIHYGTKENGHYACMIDVGGEFTLFNDEIISPNQDLKYLCSHEIAMNSYVLIYSRHPILRYKKLPEEINPINFSTIENFETNTQEVIDELDNSIIIPDALFEKPEGYFLEQSIIHLKRNKHLICKNIESSDVKLLLSNEFLQLPILFIAEDIELGVFFSPFINNIEAGLYLFDDNIEKICSKSIIFTNYMKANELEIIFRYIFIIYSKMIHKDIFVEIIGKFYKLNKNSQFIIFTSGSNNVDFIKDIPSFANKLITIDTKNTNVDYSELIKKGKLFSSFKEADIALKNWAAEKGFNLLRHTSINNIREKSTIQYYCDQSTKYKRDRRPSNKEGCDFKLNLYVNVAGICKITQLNDQHSHDLDKRFTQRQRLTDQHKRLIISYKKNLKLTVEQIIFMFNKLYSILLVKEDVYNILKIEKRMIIDSESQDLEKFINDNNGITIVKYTTDGRQREAIITFTKSEINNLLKYGEIISIDGTYFHNVNNWICIPISALNNEYRIVSCGTIFCAEPNELLATWILDQLFRIDGLKIKTVFTDEDTAFISGLEQIKSTYNFSNRFCSYHKFVNLQRKVNEIVKNPANKEAILIFFRRVMYSPKREISQRYLNKIYDLGYDELNRYIQQNIVPSSNKLFRCELDEYTKGQMTTGISESTNHIIKIGVNGTIITLLDMKKEILNAFDKKNLSEKYKEKKHRYINIEETGIYKLKGPNKIISKIKGSIKKAMRLEYKENSDVIIIFDPKKFSDEEFKVSLPESKCECNKLKIFHLPCSHLIKARLDHGLDPIEGVDPDFNVTYEFNKSMVRWNVSNNLNDDHQNDEQFSITNIAIEEEEGSTCSDTSSIISTESIEGQFVENLYNTNVNINRNTLKNIALRVIEKYKSDKAMFIYAYKTLNRLETESSSFGTDVISKKRGAKRKHRFDSAENAPNTNTCSICDAINKNGFCNYDTNHTRKKCKFLNQIIEISHRIYGEKVLSGSKCSICKHSGHNKNHCKAIPLIVKSIQKKENKFRRKTL